VNQRIYDSRAQEVVDFSPRVAGEVGLYVCGPTVQSAPHIGHLRSALVYDQMRRWMTATGHRVKIKYAEYVRLHRIVTGLNARAVWERLVAGTDPVDGIPDEFHDWVAAVVSSLTTSVDAAAASVETAYADVVTTLPDGFERRDYAVAIAAHPLRPLLFLRLDARDYRKLLWDRIADWSLMVAGVLAGKSPR